MASALRSQRNPLTEEGRPDASGRGGSVLTRIGGSANDEGPAVGDCCRAHLLHPPQRPATMVLSRSARTYRRRRSMREAVAADSGVAVEHARAKLRRRQRETEGDTPRGDVLSRDQGYSQEVRFACQHRLVQLIPVRKRSMAAVFASTAGLWAVLLLLHWAIHVRGSAVANTYVGYFFHIRSPHSLAHWVGCQAWMMTGLVSLLIWQLRRHKLDDYRAKYRIWVFLAAAAIFSSFEASTSALYLIGQSIEGWTRRELGYSGGAVVLAGFASLVAVLGVRLCTELKHSPGSVALWLGGLVAWAFSGVVGSGLLKLDWSQASVDVAVGAAWLGGVFAVLMSATLYLRHIYIQAQKRFALRNKWLSEKAAWRPPQLAALHPGRVASSIRGRFGRRRAVEVDADDLDETDKPSAKRRGERRQADEPRADTRRAARDAEEIANSLDAAEDDLVEALARSSHSSDEKAGWLRWPRRRHPPTLGDDYSDIGSEHRIRDEGLSRGFEKITAEASATNRSTKRRDESNDADEESSIDTASAGKQRGGWVRKLVPVPKLRRSKLATAGPAERSDRSDAADAFAKTQSRRRWFARKANDAVDAEPATAKKSIAKPSNQEAAETSRRSWFRRGNANGAASESKQARLQAKADKAAARQAAAASKAAAKAAAKSTGKTDTAPKGRKSIWSRWLDGVTLPPPNSEAANAPPAKAEAGARSQMSIPSTSARQQPPPQAAPQRQPVHDHQEYDDGDEADGGEHRHLSKAERKRLRRQNRAA